MQSHYVSTLAARSVVTTSEPVAETFAPEFSLHGPHSAQRAMLETFVQQKYHAAYAAEVSVFLPLLLQMSNNAQPQAALGLKPGACGGFFLEQYLNRPIEQEMAEHMGQPVSRSAIVEIGNLVSERAGSSPVLFVVMAAALEQAGYRWLAFTGTPQVKKLIQRLDSDPLVLNDADPQRLSEGCGQWGRYYDTHPQVMALDLRKAMAQVRLRPAIAALLDSRTAMIEQLAQQLCDYRRVCGVCGE